MCILVETVAFLKGVTIGDNCIIGFGSVVTRDIPANSVAVGAPARVVGSVDDYYKKEVKNVLMKHWHTQKYREKISSKTEIGRILGRISIVRR